MDDIRELMQSDDRCPDCGSLLNGQPACGHCGLELEAVASPAQVIPIGALAGLRSRRVGPDWVEEPQVA